MQTCYQKYIHASLLINYSGIQFQLFLGYRKVAMLNFFLLHYPTRDPLERNMPHNCRAVTVITNT